MRPSRPNHIGVACMLAAMLEGPQSIEDLVQASGLSVTTVRHYILTFRRQGAARIAEWQADTSGRFTVPAYALGAGRTAPRPKPVDNALRMRRVRARQSEHRVLHALAA